MSGAELVGAEPGEVPDTPPFCEGVVFSAPPVPSIEPELPGFCVAAPLFPVFAPVFVPMLPGSVPVWFWFWFPLCDPG